MVNREGITQTQMKRILNAEDSLFQIKFLDQATLWHIKELLDIRLQLGQTIYNIKCSFATDPLNLETMELLKHCLSCLFQFLNE